MPGCQGFTVKVVKVDSETVFYIANMNIKEGRPYRGSKSIVGTCLMRLLGCTIPRSPLVLDRMVRGKIWSNGSGQTGGGGRKEKKEVEEDQKEEEEDGEEKEGEEKKEEEV